MTALAGGLAPGPEPARRDADARRPMRVDPRVRAVCGALRSQSETWAAGARQLAQSSPTAAVLLEELFCALYGDRAELNPDTAPEFHQPFGVLAQLLPLADFQRLRELTAGDAVAAAMAAWRLAEVLAVAGAAEQNRRRRWFRLPARSADDARPRDAEGRAGREAAVPPLYSVIRAVRDVRGMAEADQRLRRVWGIGRGRRGIHHLDDVWRTVEDVRTLPDFAVLTDAVEQFRDLLGSALHSRRQRPGRGVQRLTGWEAGADLERVIPEESVRLSDPDLQPLFVEAFEHRRLLQIRYEGEDRGPSGPIVCCMDVSRSMNTPAALGRERFLWAKAVGLALSDFARRTGRPFIGLCFASEHELEAFELPPDRRRPETAIAMAACDFDGGTHFQTPLEKALQYIEKADGRGHIVFITDGQAALPERFRRRFLHAKARLHAQLLTVFIDGRHQDLAALSDRVFELAPHRLASWETTVAGLGQSVGAGGVSGRS